MAQEVIHIPIVFHVLHSNAEEEISTQQLMSQLEALNRDFDLSDYRDHYPTDPEVQPAKRIQFCFPTFDPQGNTTDGFHYVKTDVKEFGKYNRIKRSEEGGVDAWPTEAYLNVWVGNLGDLSCYAHEPGGPAVTDGVVVDYEYFGTEGKVKPFFNQGKTLSHMVAVYLGLGEISLGEMCLDSINQQDCFGYGRAHLFSYGRMKEMLEVFATNGARVSLLSTEVSCSEGREQIAIADSETKERLRLDAYPIPTDEELHVSVRLASSGKLEINVYNALGEAYYKREFEHNGEQFEQTLDCSQWPPGIYLIQCQSGDLQKWKQVIIY